MPSRSAKGSYYAKRTRDWIEEYLGLEVAPLEQTRRIIKKRKDPLPGEPEHDVINVKHDIWGADLMAKGSERLVFVQVKSNAGDVSKGIKELSRGRWPPWVERWVVYWPPRRLKKYGPEIVEVGPEEAV